MGKHWQVTIFNVLSRLFSNSHNYPLIWVQLSSPFCRWANWGTEKLDSFPRSQLSGQDGVRTCLSDFRVHTLYHFTVPFRGLLHMIGGWGFSSFQISFSLTLSIDGKRLACFLASLRLSVVFKAATRGAQYQHRERKLGNKTKPRIPSLKIMLFSNLQFEFW